MWEKQKARLREAILCDLQRHYGCRLVVKDLMGTLVYDFLLVSFLIAPLFVLSWKGSWQNADLLVDEVISKGKLEVSAIVSLVTGYTLWIIIYLSQGWIQRFAESGSKIRYILVTRTFTLVVFNTDVLAWKGIWGTYDNIVGRTVLSTSLCTLLPLALLISTQSVMTVPSCPTGAGIDIRSKYFPLGSFFSYYHERLSLKILDAFVSSTINFVSYHVYYGFWSLQDLYFDDADAHRSIVARNGAVGAAVGMFSSFLVFLLQFPVLMLHPTGTEGFESKADNFKSLIAHQALDVLAIFGSISGFRGFWVMFQLYIMPDDDPLLFNIFGQVAGPLLLFLVLSGTTLHGGTSREKDRLKTGVLYHYFFVTYFKAHKAEDDKHLTMASLEDEMTRY